MRDLHFVKNPNGGRPFKLLPLLQDKWRDIGLLLGLEHYLGEWQKMDVQERLRRIFMKWKECAMNLDGDSERYSYSWDGLYNLLMDTDEQVAQSYFQFLETVPIKK